MTKYYNLLIAGVLSTVIFSSCIDDNYDLGNVDTTSRFSVKDLVLPINLETIKLENIITVDEDDDQNQLRTVNYNGQPFYAIEQTGNFESDEIVIDRFTATPVALSPSQGIFRLQGSSGNALKKADSPGKIYLLVEEVYKDLTYSASNIDGAIRGLDKIYYTNDNDKIVNFVINFDINLPSGVTAYINNVKLRLPKGLNVVGISTSQQKFDASKYNASNGVISLDKVNLTGKITSLTISSDNTDLSYYPNSFSYDAQTNSGSFKLESEFTFEQGTLVVEGSAAQLAGINDDIYFDVTYQLDRFVIKSVMATVQYKLDGPALDIKPITLKNLPVFLSGPETNLVLANPQIYLSLNNPIGEYGLYYKSGLDIQTYRDNEKSATFPLGRELSVDPAPGDYKFLLAPQPGKVATDNRPEGYQQAQDITYPNLGNIVAGAGLPSSIDIELLDPMVPEKKTTQPIKLGTKLEAMIGSYTFLAPLALDGSAGANSKIVYTETKDGWNDETLDHLTITLFKLNCKISNDIPLDAEMAIYPIDKEGKLIIPEKEIKMVRIPGNTQDYDATFIIEGEITGLDGIIIVADVTPEDGVSDVLRPNQTITLTNSKVTVSGNYTNEF